MAGVTLHDLLVKALEHYRTGEPDRARALYELILAYAPDNTNALQLYGILLRRAQDDIESGIRLLRRAAAIDPDFTDVRINLANMLTCHERPDEAIEVLLELLRRHPGHRAALHTVGTLLLLRQRWDEAVIHLEALLRLDPGHEDARRHLNLAYRGRPRLNVVDNALLLAAAHHRAGRLMDAETAYRQILKSNPGHAATLLQFAELALQTGRRRLAAYLADRAAALCPADARVRHRRDALHGTAQAA